MEPILKLENLHKSYGELEVLTGIDLAVYKGETIVLIGSSGSGKSTMLRCINFMELPTEGRILLKINAWVKKKQSETDRLRSAIPSRFSAGSEKK
jgi:ABC-type histidine transport system ATPase subunit